MSASQEFFPEPWPVQEARRHIPCSTIETAVRDGVAAVTPSLRSYLEAIPLKLFGLDSGFFHLAAAQALDWGLDADAWLNELARAAAFGSVHFAVQDMAIDAQHTTPEMILLCDVAQSLYARAVLRLCPGEVLLPYYDRYFDQYAAAIIMERKHQRHIIAYTTEDVLSLGDKASPLNLAFPILINQARRSWSLLPGIERSLRLLCVGLQLHDDIADTSEDLSNGYVSYPSTVALLECLGVPPGRLPDDLDVTRVEDCIYAAGVASAAYGMANKMFDRSAELAEASQAGAVAMFARYWRTRTDRRLQRIGEVEQSLRGAHA